MDQPWRRAMAGSLAGLALLPAAPAAAASQGSLGPVSRGSLTISISVRAPTRVSGLADVAFDGTAGAGAARDLCLRGIPHAYTLAASGNGPGGSMSLSNGAEHIAYRVEWQPRSGAGPVDTLSGTAPVMVRAVADPADCGEAPGAGRLRIALDAAEAARLQADARYTGALYLMLSPE